MNDTKRWRKRREGSRSDTRNLNEQREKRGSGAALVKPKGTYVGRTHTHTDAPF